MRHYEILLQRNVPEHFFSYLVAIIPIRMLKGGGLGSFVGDHLQSKTFCIAIFSKMEIIDDFHIQE